MQSDLFDHFPAPRQRDAAVLAGRVHGQQHRPRLLPHHGLSVNARSIAYTFPLAFIPYTRRCIVAGKFFAIPLSGRIMPFCPVASTRYPCPCAEISPVHSHIIDRVARVSRVIFAAVDGGTLMWKSSVGCSIVNGTFGLFDSTSCSTMSREANLYDLFMPSTRPSRTTCSTQS